MRRLVIFVVIAGLLLPALAPAQEQKPLNSDFATSFLSGVLSSVYFPIKLAVAVAVAPIGGAVGFLTGGNERAAEAIWRPFIGGTYFITPEMLEGSEPFLPVGRRAHRPQDSPKRQKRGSSYR